MTNVPANAVFTDTVYTHPSSHPISMITGLPAALNAKQDALTTLGSAAVGQDFRVPVPIDAALVEFGNRQRRFGLVSNAGDEA